MADAPWFDYAQKQVKDQVRTLRIRNWKGYLAITPSCASLQGSNRLNQSQTLSVSHRQECSSHRN